VQKPTTILHFSLNLVMMWIYFSW